MMKRQNPIVTSIKRTTVLTALVVAAASLAAVPAAAQLTCQSLEVVDGALPSGDPAVLPAEFGVRDVLDLGFRLQLPAELEGQHVVEMRVFTPDGSLYRSMSAPFAAPTWRGASSVEVRDYPRPMRVLSAESHEGPRGTSMMVSMPFPVAGTDIVNRGIYGEWSVVAHLDYSDEACTAQVPFTLQARSPLAAEIFADGFEGGSTNAWSR